MAKRTSFHFSEEAAQQLKVIAKLAKFASPGDAARTAVLRLDEILDLYRTGGELFVRTAAAEELPYHYRLPLDYEEFDRFIETHFDNAKVTLDKTDPSQFFFSGEYLEAISRIKAKIGSISNADIIRLAIAAYRDLTVVTKVKSQLWYRASDGFSRKIDIHQAIAPQILHDGVRAERKVA